MNLKTKNKVFMFLGTNAELIKLAPVIKEFRKNKVNFKLVTSGQGNIHFEEFKDYLKINSQISLRQKSDRSSPLFFLLWSIKAFFSGLLVFKRELNTSRSKIYLIIHGDTISSLIGALIAKVYGVNLVHIESGLRSFDFKEPFPEEISRYIISSLATIHFCPNQWSVDNLKSKAGLKINTHQNTLLDIHRFAVQKNLTLNDLPRKYYVLVIHRQEHVIFDRKKTLQILKEILNSTQDIPCVLIMHKLTSDFMKSFGIEESFLKNKQVILRPRLSYMEFTSLLKNSQFVITDGGSNQEESYYLGKPCLILRNKTERIEGLGENAVLGGFNDSLIKDFVSNYKRFRRSPVTTTISPSEIISKYLMSQILSNHIND